MSVLRITLSLIIVCISHLPCIAQYEDLWNQYNEKNYETVLRQAMRLYPTHSKDAELNLLIGRALADTSNFVHAIPYLQQVVKVAPKQYAKTKSWAYYYLGMCYCHEKKIQDAKVSFAKCADNNPSENLQRLLGRTSAQFGFDDYYKTFIIKETPHFVFHFHPAALDSISDVQQYMQKHERAFDSIRAFFGNSVPNKIDFFVWHDRKIGKQILSTNVGFAKSEYQLIHSMYNQTVGHELTHVISHFAAPCRNKSRLVNEGTAVYFDLTSRDKFSSALKAMRRTRADSVSVRRLWEDLEVREAVLYPIAGAFIEMLILKEGKEKYLQLTADQRYTNAQKIYGDKLDEMIAWFEKELNSAIQ